MNVYLFYVSNNRFWKYFPNSVLALANPLIKAGFHPVIIDTALQDWRNVSFEEPFIAGFSIYTDENITTALDIASAIRSRYPRARLVWGGPHVIILSEQTAGHPLVDIACYGEGEDVLPAAAAAIRDGADDFSGIPGIYWKDRRGNLVKNGKGAFVDLDSVELHPYELLDEKLYGFRNGKMYYEASRGCPFGCRFCNYDHTRWRFRSARRVIADLAALEEHFSPQEIQLVDANHFMNLQWVQEIWTAKLKAGLKFSWETNCRFDTMARIQDPLLKMLRESGCYQLRFGAESGSQKMLDYLNKGIKVEEISSGVRRCREFGINPVLSFMMGYPPEEESDLDATLRLIDRLRDSFPGIHINGLFQFQPYPNTKIFEDIVRTYHIPQPLSLEGWASYQIIEFHRTDFPWINKRKYRSYVVLNSIVSYCFFADRFFEIVKNPALTAIVRVIDVALRKTLVRLRWNKGFMLFPAEWYIWNFIRKHILKLF